MKKIEIVKQNDNFFMMYVTKKYCMLKSYRMHINEGEGKFVKTLGFNDKQFTFDAPVHCIAQLCQNKLLVQQFAFQIRLPTTQDTTIIPRQNPKLQFKNGVSPSFNSTNILHKSLQPPQSQILEFHIFDGFDQFIQSFEERTPVPLSPVTNIQKHSLEVSNYIYQMQTSQIDESQFIFQRIPAAIEFEFRKLIKVIESRQKIKKDAINLLVEKFNKYEIGQDSFDSLINYISIHHMPQQYLASFETMVRFIKANINE